MQRIRYLLGNVTLMNLLLAGIMISFMRYMSSPPLHDNFKHNMATAKKTTAQGLSKNEESEDRDKSPSPSDYMIIAEQNLFHPDRIIPAPKAEASPLPQPEFVLYGTLIADGVQIAYIDDKKSNDAKNKGAQAKKQTALRLGDSLSGFILKQVDKEQVLMQRGEEKISVYLSQAKTREMPGTPPTPDSVQKQGTEPQSSPDRSSRLGRRLPRQRIGDD